MPDQNYNSEQSSCLYLDTDYNFTIEVCSITMRLGMAVGFVAGIVALALIGGTGPVGLFFCIGCMLAGALLAGALTVATMGTLKLVSKVSNFFSNTKKTDETVYTPKLPELSVVSARPNFIPPSVPSKVASMGAA